MKTKKSFPYIALYITAIAAGSLVSFLFKFFTDNPYNFWNVVVPSAIAEVEQLLGNPTKARTVLGWNPCKTPFPELVKIMVRHDMAKVKRMIATKHD